MLELFPHDFEGGCHVCQVSRVVVVDRELLHTYIVDSAICLCVLELAPRLGGATWGNRCNVLKFLRSQRP